MGSGSRASYEHKAQKLQQQRYDELAARREDLLQQINSLRDSQKEEARSSELPICRLSGARFSATQLSNANTVHASAMFSRPNVATLRAASAERVGAPPQHVCDALQAMGDLGPVTADVPRAQTSGALLHVSVLLRCRGARGIREGIVLEAAAACCSVRARSARIRWMCCSWFRCRCQGDFIPDRHEGSLFVL